MATPRYASGTNVFIPQATGMAVAFVRDPAKFKVNQYCQTFKSTDTDGEGRPVCLYAVLDPDEPIRVVTDEEYDWPDGQDRPDPKGNVGNFQWEEVRMYRRFYGYRVGEQLVDCATGFKPQAFFNAIVLSKAMTNLSKRVVSLIENTSNWGNNYGTAAALSGIIGCRWDMASNDETNGQFLAIKKTLDAAKVKINLATNSLVQPSDLVLVLNPDAAMRMSETAEIHHYLAQSRFALAQVRGDSPGQNALWGLPDELYGVKVVVEDASYVNVRPAADGTAATLSTEKVYCKARTSAVLLSRVGGLDGNYGSPSFSTLQRYYYKYELAVEAMHDSWNKVYKAGVVDQYKEVLAAPQSGYLITSIMP